MLPASDFLDLDHVNKIETHVNEKKKQDLPFCGGKNFLSTDLWRRPLCEQWHSGGAGGRAVSLLLLPPHSQPLQQQKYLYIRNTITLRRSLPEHWTAVNFVVGTAKSMTIFAKKGIPYGTCFPSFVCFLSIGYCRRILQKKNPRNKKTRVESIRV
jgi:hypothetical protein